MNKYDAIQNQIAHMTKEERRNGGTDIKVQSTGFSEGLICTVWIRTHNSEHVYLANCHSMTI